MVRNNSILFFRLRLLTALCFFLITSPALVLAGEFTAFGPQNFIRATGTPVIVTNNFSVLNPDTEFFLRVYNGSLQDTATELVSSSIVSINGKQVVGPEEFNQKVKFIEVPVTLQSINTIEVEVRGKPGGVLSIRIVGIDDVAPHIQIIDPPDGSLTDINPYEIKLNFSDDISGINPNSFKIFINGVDKTNSFTITTTGLSGSAVSNLLLSEGTNVINASISDFAGNTGSVSASFTVDTTPPVISNLLPADGSILANARPAISVDFSDNISGIDASTVKITLDGIDVTSNARITPAGFSYTPTTDLSDGTHTVTVDVKDKATNPATEAKWTFVTDITPPQVNIVSVISPTNISTQTITGSYIEERIKTIKVNGINAAIDDIKKTYSIEISLSEGTNKIEVIAVDLAGNTGSASATILLDTTPPAVPTGLVATAGDTIVDLNWSANTEPDLAGYNIFRSKTQGGSYSKLNSELITLNSYQNKGLINGNTYYYVLTSQDRLGNESMYSSEVSATPRIMLQVTAKANPVIGSLPLTVNFSADVLGNILLYEWDFDGDGIYDWSSSISPNTTYTYRTIGTYNAKIKVTDILGNIVTDTITITANKPLVAIPKVAPTSGVKPLTVTFTPAGTDATGTIIKFEWDYDGNGTWDWSSTLPDTSSRAYKVAGTYNAMLRVTNNYGLTDTAGVMITVTNPSPTVTCSATPTSGPIPLTVAFSGSASSPNGAITKYEWDFEGNGSYDWTSSTGANTSYTYINVGTYHATLKATDAIGESATAMVIVRALPVGSPTVIVSANPTKGNSPLTVNFSGSASSPNGAITKYEWDFNNDGVFDWSSTTTGNTSYTYNIGGIFDATLKATDVTGEKGYGSVRINVNIILSLTRDKDTINPTQGQTVTVTTQYSGAAAIKLFVKDSNGQIVCLLVSGENRAAGTYTDIWDGRDDNDEILLDDVYYLVADAIMPGGLTQTYDLTGTGITGTKRSIGGNSATFPASFAPYEDQFCPITYNVPVAGKVVADICPYSYYGERVRALLQFIPQGKGSHTIYWDGMKDDGGMVPPATIWLVAIWSYDLTSNGIVVEGSKPEITALSADPNYYCPDEPLPTGLMQLNISFSLSKAANVVVKIYDSTNAVVKTISQSNMPAGQNSIIWNGKNENGEYVNNTAYHIGVKAIDDQGNHSLTRYAHIILFY